MAPKIKEESVPQASEDSIGKSKASDVVESASQAETSGRSETLEATNSEVLRSKDELSLEGLPTEKFVVEVSPKSELYKTALRPSAINEVDITPSLALRTQAHLSPKVATGMRVVEQPHVKPLKKRHRRFDFELPDFGVGEYTSPEIEPLLASFVPIYGGWDSDLAGYVKPKCKDLFHCTPSGMLVNRGRCPKCGCR